LSTKTHFSLSKLQHIIQWQDIDPGKMELNGQFKTNEIIFTAIMHLTHTLLSANAEHWIFAFYGYGQQAEVFRPLAEKLKGKYNLLVIDLPVQWQDVVIEKTDFIRFLDELVARYSIQKITGLSYSMGSRFNLVMAERCPELIDKLILVAPDGIRMRLWNRFSTSTLLGNWIFQYLVNSKNAYANAISFLYRMKLMPKTMYAFSKWHMRDRECRTKVYNAWINMKKMIPDLKLLKQKKEECGFDMMAYFGKSDTIINQACLKRLARKIPSAKIVSLNKGHNLLDEELFDTIAEHI
jgi:hypothetical protein